MMIEESMHPDCEYCIKRDICTMDVPKPCDYRYTEDERKADQASDLYGAILNNTYLPNTYKKTKRVIENEEARKLAEINHLKDEVAKLRRENEDLKKVLWAVADKVKDFKKEDK